MLATERGNHLHFSNRMQTNSQRPSLPVALFARYGNGRAKIVVGRRTFFDREVLLHTLSVLSWIGADEQPSYLSDAFESLKRETSQ
jgi:hypothetical protein